MRFGPSDDEPVSAPTDPVVVVPARPLWSGPQPGVAIEVRRDPAGERVVVCFSSPTRLASVLGGHQPWVAVPFSAVAAFAATAGLRQVQIDPEPDGPVDRWTATDAATAVEVSDAMRTAAGRR